jgi:hypothetical protein
VEKSHEIISERAKDGSLYDKMRLNLPNEIVPVVLEDGDPSKWA